MNNNRINYFGRICSANGVSLICDTDFVVSDVDFLPEFGRDSVVHPQYMGDQDFADADNNWFYVAWGDKRNAGLDPRMNPGVFFDRIATGLVGTDVSEPASLALLGLGLAGITAIRRKRR